MKVRDTLIGAVIGFGAAALSAQAATNWIQEAVMVRLPQSEVVRHPVDNGKYYLCWTDGKDRYGMAFRRSKLDQQIRSIPRASRASVAGLLGEATSSWSASDEKICWPGK